MTANPELHLAGDTAFLLLALFLWTLLLTMDDIFDAFTVLAHALFTRLKNRSIPPPPAPLSAEALSAPPLKESRRTSAIEHLFRTGHRDRTL